MKNTTRGRIITVLFLYAVFTLAYFTAWGLFNLTFWLVLGILDITPFFDITVTVS